MGRRPDYDLDGVRVHGGLRGASWGVDLAATADVVVSHAGVPIPDVGGVHVRMVHGAGLSDIGGDLAVFPSEHLAGMADHPHKVVCHPPTWPDRHRVAERGDRVTIVNLSRPKGVDTAWACAEADPERRWLGVIGGYGEQRRPRCANFEVVESQPDMRTVWARTRVLAMPSAYESWGMVAVEALASGIPVVAHPCGGLVEALGDAGIFVDRDDIDGWLAALDELDDPDRYADASQAALARSAELDPQASIDRFVGEVEALCMSRC